MELADEDSQEQCAEVNRAFISRLTRGRPYITLKFASSLDGKIASRTGRSKYITGEEARRLLAQQEQREAKIAVLRAELKKETQFNRKVELNMEIKRLEKGQGGSGNE